MFKAEKTNTIARQKVLDENGKNVAALYELYNGDWGLHHIKTGDPLTPEHFRTEAKAIKWLNNNPEILNEV